MTQPKPMILAALLVTVGWIAGWTGCSADRQNALSSLDLLPEHILETFALRSNELADGFSPLQEPELLAEAGLSGNPAFITREADRKLQVQIQAFGGILGLYGTEEEVLLVLKGYFFPDAEAAETYLNIQEGLSRKINAYEVPTPGGIWLLFLATDPEREYSSQEIEAIRRGLDRYQARLNATSRFEQIRAANP